MTSIVDENGTYEPLIDICDDWKPLGDPSPNGRLTAPGLGDRAGGHVAVVERGKNDTSTVWAATSTGRVFIAKNADATNPAAVQFVRLDSLAANDPPRYPSAIYVDPEDSNHAWMTYSGFNAKTPDDTGARLRSPLRAGAGRQPGDRGLYEPRRARTRTTAYPDIPATAIVVSDKGTIYVGNDFGVVRKNRELSQPGTRRAAGYRTSP